MIDIAIAVVAGTVWYFGIGWVFFELLLGRFMAAHMTNVPGFYKREEESSLFWLLVSCAAYALLLAVLCTWWIEGETILDGFWVGALIGGFISGMTSTYWYATSNLFANVKPILADIGAAVITVGSLGAVVVGVLNLLS